MDLTLLLFPVFNAATTCVLSVTHSTPICTLCLARVVLVTYDHDHYWSTQELNKEAQVYIEALLEASKLEQVHTHSGCLMSTPCGLVRDRRVNLLAQ